MNLSTAANIGISIMVFLLFIGLNPKFDYTSTGYRILWFNDITKYGVRRYIKLWKIKK